MSRQLNQFDCFSPIQNQYTKSTPKSQLSHIISSITRQQQKSLVGIAEKCSSMEYVIASVEVLVSRLSQRLQKISEEKQSEMLGALKMKQNDFIINQLKGSLSKQMKKQERLMEELDCERKKVEKFREEMFKIETKNNTLAAKVNRLEYMLKEKQEEIKKVNQSLQKQKQQMDNQHSNKVKFSKNIEKDNKNQYYQQFQSKIEQLERELQLKVSALDSKNKDLLDSLKKTQEKLEEERGIAKISKKQIEELKMNKYQLEIKMKQMNEVNSQLEDSYNKLLEKNKNTEITLHKQIQQFKNKDNNLRNDYKKEKKVFKQHLSTLAQYINNSKYYLISNTLGEQVQEIKKLFDKVIKKKTEHLTRQSDYYQTQYKAMKAKNEQIEQTLHHIEKQQKQDSAKKLRLSQKSMDRSDIGQLSQKRSETGSSLINRSIDRIEDERLRSFEQKYKNKIQTLKKDTKVKQNRINELEKLQQVEFDKSKERILELQLALSQKGNQIRKLELKSKQKQYQMNDLRKTIKDFENKVTYLTERNESQKQTSTKMLEMKVQNYEQKLKQLKNAHKQLEKRQQQKTIKYNKLKNKYDKYDMEASESLKRKNTQIDQLLKQNNKLKTENKLLEEKININNIIEKEINANKTPVVVNQDLIEQIEMERDRISNELTQKQKQCSEIIEVNSKMSSQILILKRQNRQTKTRFEQIAKENRHIQDELRLAKEKIQDLKEARNQEEEQNHAYFKKQLEKSLLNHKKLESTCQKLATDKKNLKKDIEQLRLEQNGLKATVDKLKQNNIKLSDQVLDEKERNKKLTDEYQIKISQFNARQSQLVDIINYKNRQTGNIRESMKGDDSQGLSPMQQIQILKVSKQTSTSDLVEVVQQSMETDKIQVSAPRSSEKNSHKPSNPIIPSEILFDQSSYEEQLLQSTHQPEVASQKVEKEPPKEVNYFNDLVMDNEAIEEHFDICDEQDEININKATFNLQVKDVFNNIRRVIEKVFNEEDVQIEQIKMLPRQVEDDFTEFISYVKEKIYEIKNQNNLSFIMAEVGNEPQSIQAQLADFISRESPQYMRLRKIIQEKEYMITGLMNEKTEQQNTINQLTVEKEQIEEENENRFMNQCNVYKKEIKQYKKLIDIMEMNCQSLKNIFKNTMELWVDENDNEDDIKDNMVLFTNICRLSQTDKKKLNHCLEVYRQTKRNT